MEDLLPLLMLWLERYSRNVMNQIPNYYAEWWNKARTNPGTVLTKPRRHHQELAQKDYQIQLLQNANGILEVEHFPLREEIAQLEQTIQD